jgi:hypothetical protein
VFGPPKNYPVAPPMVAPGLFNRVFFIPVILSVRTSSLRSKSSIRRRMQVCNLLALKITTKAREQSNF